MLDDELNFHHFSFLPVLGSKFVRSAGCGCIAAGTWDQVAVREELGPERGTTKFLLQLQDSCR